MATVGSHTAARMPASGRSEPGGKVPATWRHMGPGLCRAQTCRMKRSSSHDWPTQPSPAARIQFSSSARPVLTYSPLLKLQHSRRSSSWLKSCTLTKPNTCSWGRGGCQPPQAHQRCHQLAAEGQRRWPCTSVSTRSPAGRASSQGSAARGRPGRPRAGCAASSGWRPSAG